MAERDRRARRF